VVAIGAALDEFDLVVDAIEAAVMDRVVAMVEDSLTMSLQRAGETLQLRMTDRACKGAPLPDRPRRPQPVPVGPNPGEHIPKHVHLRERLVELPQRLQMLVVLAPAHTLSQQEIAGAFEDLLVLGRGFSIFASAHLVDEPAVGGHHVEEVEDDLYVRHGLGEGLDVGLMHVHVNRLQGLFLLIGHTVEEGEQGLLGASLAHPDHPAGLVVDDHGHVVVALAQGDLVDGEDVEPAVVGLGVILLQEGLVDALDRLPVQAEVAGHVGEGHDLAQFVDAPRQASGHPLPGVDRFQALDNDPLAHRAEDLAVGKAQAHAGRGEVEITHRAHLRGADARGRGSALVAQGREPFVRSQVDDSQVGLGADILSADNHSTPGEIGCYTDGRHRRSFLFQKSLSDKWIQDKDADVIYHMAA